VLDVAAEAVEHVQPTLAAEILLADSSEAHLARGCSTGACDGGCAVPTPKDCPAMRCGARLEFDSSRRFDACPFLKRRGPGDRSAACIPIGIMGKTIGILHAVGPAEQTFDEPILEKLEAVARKLGERIGVVRAFERSEKQAATDPLTGLLNRRSVEDAIVKLNADRRSFAIAYGGIDHFKRLNDTHGHETGDRALRLLSDLMRAALRPNDILGRWGGEEFVVLLPDVDVAAAERIIARLRSRLSDRLADGAAPRFTVSFGLCGPEIPGTFDERLSVADAALLKAKATGRDRIVVAGRTDADPRDADEHDAPSNAEHECLAAV